MKKFNILSIVFAMLMLTATVNAQNIAISDVAHTADASAVLDVYSTSLGMLMPRLTTTQRTGITSPATGLTVFDTDNASYWYYDGSAWTELSYGNLWSRTGTDTYLSNTGDNLVIGTNTSAPGYKFYVHGATSQMSRFDGQVEFWATAGGPMDADINDDGSGNGILNIYSNGTKRVQLSSLGNSYFTGGAVAIGGTIPNSLLHIFDINGFGQPQILLDNPSGGANTGIGYQFGSTNYTQGIEPNTNNFVLCNTPTINPPMQSDATTMMNAFPNGIIDMNNQSRSRVFQSIMTLPPYGGQMIPFQIWTPVTFDAMSYDQHMEFTLGTIPGTTYFTATEEGYYQVNSRIDFMLINEMEEQIHYPNYPGYVSIAIFKHDNQGLISMYAQGNKLQGADNNSGWNDLQNNLAPNISDVVYLQKGEKIEIRAFQNLWGNGLPLRIINMDDPTNPGNPDTQIYVSIHKSS